MMMKSGLLGSSQTIGNFCAKCEREICLTGTLGMLDYDSVCCQNLLFVRELSIREIYSFGNEVKNQMRKICHQNCISLKRVIYKKLVLNALAKL